MKKYNLGDLVIIRTGKLDANASSSGGKYPFFTCSRTPLRINSFSYDCECVLVAGNGDLNVKYYSGKFDAYQRTYIIESKDKSILNTRYLYWFLFKYVERLRELAIGGVIKYIKLNNLTDPLINLPELSKQKEIVELLDQSNLLIDNRKLAIEMLDEFLESTFLEMFGDPVTNPKNWQRLNGDEYAKKISVGVVVRPASYYVDTGIPALRSQNITKDGISMKNLVYFSAEDNEKKLSKSIIRTNDVLIVRTGQPGTAAIVPKKLDGANCIDVIIVKLNTEILTPEYLVTFFNSVGGKDIVLKTARGQIQQHFNVGALNEAKIPIPSLELQKEFSNIFTKHKMLKLKMIKQSKEMDNQFQALMQKAFN